MTSVHQAVLSAVAQHIITPFPISHIGDIRQTPTDASGGFTVRSDGAITLAGNASTTDNNNWYIPTGAGAGNPYFLQVTLNSGVANTSGDALNTPLALSSNRSFTWTETGNSQRDANLTVVIADNAGMTPVLATRTFTVFVDVEL